MAWSPDGAFFVSPTTSTKWVFTKTGYPICNLTRPEWADITTWSPDGDYIATGGYDGVLKIYDADPIYQMPEKIIPLMILVIISILILYWAEGIHTQHLNTPGLPWRSI